jgi:hypothetical protein
MKRLALKRPGLIRKAIREEKLKSNQYVPESEKSSKSKDCKNLDGYMLFNGKNRIRPLLKKSTGIPGDVRGLT